MKFWSNRILLNAKSWLSKIFKVHRDCASNMCQTFAKSPGIQGHRKIRVDHVFRPCIQTMCVSAGSAWPQTPPCGGGGGGRLVEVAVLVVDLAVGVAVAAAPGSTRPPLPAMRLRDMPALYRYIRKSGKANLANELQPGTANTNDNARMQLPTSLQILNFLQPCHWERNSLSASSAAPSRPAQLPPGPPGWTETVWLQSARQGACEWCH